MKRTQIKYVIVGNDHVKILEVTNVASESDLIKEFGINAFLAYINTPVIYIQQNNKCVIVNQSKLEPITKEHIHFVPTDTIITKEELSRIVAIMKQAGKNLASARKANVDTTITIKTITI